MNLAQPKRAAKEFAERWQRRGDEKQDCQSFWTDFLEHGLDVPYASSAVQFERKIDLGKDARTGRSHTDYIDGCIPATMVPIEQKGAKIDLKKPAAEAAEKAAKKPHRKKASAPATNTASSSF